MRLYFRDAQKRTGVVKNESVLPILRGIHIMTIRPRSQFPDSLFRTLATSCSNKPYISSCLDSEVTISRAVISEKGYPVISLSTEASYTFNAELGVW